ncbi:TPA: DUF4035 domain-containing protein [Providencia alcalifaciens]
MLTLALRLGKTLSEIGTMPASELQIWWAFDSINPIGDSRLDVHAAQVTAAIFNAQGVKTTLNDTLIQWDAESVQGKEHDRTGLEDFFTSLSE